VVRRAASTGSATSLQDTAGWTAKSNRASAWTGGLCLERTAGASRRAPAGKTGRAHRSRRSAVRKGRWCTARCALQFRAVDPPLRLPIHYNHLVQGLVYGLLEVAFAQKVHQEGFRAGGRQLRLFAFSRLLGPYVLHREALTIEFPDVVRLVVSSPVEDFVRALGRTLLDRSEAQLGGARLRLESVRFDHPRVPDGAVRFRTLSPVTVFSTVERPDGTRFTYYFEPRSGEFRRLAVQNLARKYEAATGRPYAGPGADVRWVSAERLSVVRYRGGVVKGYTGVLEAEGDPVLLQLALDAGLGAKNAQGFGLLEVVDDRQP
jgi:CRISPR-associated endoribonuclease Cas6